MESIVQKYEKKEFMGKEITCAWVDDKCYVFLKPIVEDLGLAWRAQRRRIVEDESWDSRVLPLETNSGVQESVFLLADDFFGWLYTVEPGKINRLKKSESPMEKPKKPSSPETHLDLDKLGRTLEFALDKLLSEAKQESHTPMYGIQQALKDLKENPDV